MLFDAFEREFELRAMGWTFETTGCGEQLLQGFGAALHGDPVVVVAVTAADMEGKGFGDAGEHEDFLTRFLTDMLRVERGGDRTEMRMVAGE